VDWHWGRGGVSNSEEEEEEEEEVPEEGVGRVAPPAAPVQNVEAMNIGVSHPQIPSKP
jgi:hypothetical protein